MQLCIIYYDAHRQDGCCDHTTMYNDGRKERKNLCTIPIIPTSNTHIHHVYIHNNKKE